VAGQAHRSTGVCTGALEATFYRSSDVRTDAAEGVGGDGKAGLIMPEIILPTGFTEKGRHTFASLYTHLMTVT